MTKTKNEEKEVFSGLCGTERIEKEVFSTLAAIDSNEEKLITEILIKDRRYIHYIFWALNNNYPEIVIKILCVDKIQKDISIYCQKPPENQQNNIRVILCSLVRKGHLEVLNKLLEIPFVSQVASGDYNYIFRLASCYGNVHIIERLLKIDRIYFNAYANSNEALKNAIKNNFEEVFFLLIKNKYVKAFLSRRRQFCHGVEELCLAVDEVNIKFINEILKIKKVHDIEASYKYHTFTSLTNGNLIYKDICRVAIVLAENFWPGGLKSIPMDLRDNKLLMGAIRDGSKEKYQSFHIFSLLKNRRKSANEAVARNVASFLPAFTTALSDHRLSSFTTKKTSKTYSKSRKRVVGSRDNEDGNKRKRVGMGAGIGAGACKL